LNKEADIEATSSKHTSVKEQASATFTKNASNLGPEGT